METTKEALIEWQQGDIDLKKQVKKSSKKGNKATKIN